MIMGESMRFFRKQKTKGAISIFLVMILVPTLLLSAVLIDGSRMASARAMTQEAGDLAAASALASYNQDLKDDYGLFAIKDADKIEEIYKESLKATLYASGLSDDEAYSEKIWGILKSQLGAGNPYKGKEFLNLYDFSVDSCKVEPMYSLANQEVLENQMIEYAKFRGIYVMADRLGIVGDWAKAKEEQEQVSESSEAMESKMDVDEKNAKADKALEELRMAIRELNAAVEQVKTSQTTYFSNLQSEMERIKNEYESDDEDDDRESRRQNQKAQSDYKTSRTELKDALGKAKDKAGTVYKKAQQAKKEVEKSIERLDKFQDEYSQKAASNEDIEEMRNDASEGVQEYKEIYMKQIDDLLNDDVLKKLKDDSGLKNRVDKTMNQIDTAIRKYGKENPRQDSSSDSDSDEDDEEEEDVEYYFYYLNSGGMTTEVSQALRGSSKTRSYEPAVSTETAYFQNKHWIEINPTQDLAESKSGSSPIDSDFAKDVSDNEEESSSSENPKARGEVDSSTYNALPSRNKAQIDAEKKKDAVFYNTDGDLSGAKKILQNGKNSLLLQAGELVRDDVLGLSYMFGTFRTRLTGVEKFSKKGMSDADKNSFYMPKWRYAHDDGEQDMRFNAKKDRDSVLRGEVEYLVYGMRTDQGNEDSVYATIYAERLVNNMIAVYRNDEVNAACTAAGGAASAATFGVVPISVFKWIFITAWAVAETYVDMDYLVNGGYRIPLIKTKKNLILTADPKKWKENDKDLKKNYQEKGIFVTYEDYLLIMLVIKGKEKRLLRTADLIEMNMKKKDSEFSMTKAYTYLRAESDMSVRYLFGSVAPFQAEYERNGVTGRMKFQSTIYQGY